MIVSPEAEVYCRAVPSTSPIRVAVIPAAGQGTRMLPATKAVPKELLPVLEQPALQLVIDEAVGAGVDHVVIVTSHHKPAIERYFEPNPDVEEALERQGRRALAERRRRFENDVRVSFVYQDEPLGLGHAIACAARVVGERPFFVLLPDELMADPSLLVELAAESSRTGRSAVALKRVPRDEVFRYGVVAPVGPIDGSLVRFDRVVEKPTVNDAPSDLVIIGRYALDPSIFADLAALAPAPSGEIQLSDALSRQASFAPLSGLVSTIGRRDIGHPVGWLQAVVEAGLEHPEYGPAFAAWLDDRRRG